MGWQRGQECGRGRARARVPSLLPLWPADIGIKIFYIGGQLQEALSAGVQGVIIQGLFGGLASYHKGVMVVHICDVMLAADRLQIVIALGDGWLHVMKEVMTVADGKRFLHSDRRLFHCPMQMLPPLQSFTPT